MKSSRVRNKMTLISKFDTKSAHQYFSFRSKHFTEKPKYSMTLQGSTYSYQPIAYLDSLMSLASNFIE